MKNSWKAIASMCLLLTGILGLCGCTSTESENGKLISSALEDMYSSNFTYTVSTTAYNMDDELVTYNYTGEYTANPYVEHQVYETDEYSYWKEIYYYSDSDDSGDVVQYQGLHDGEWLVEKAGKIYVKGYDEDIKIVSQKEETIDGEVYIVYSTEYTTEASRLYGLSEKVEATVSQQYYLEKESGKIARIVTDCTDLNRMTYIANSMANNGTDIETAQKEADAYGMFEESEDMKIEYQDENFKINIPLNN